jgi:chromosome segregation ATPase
MRLRAALLAALALGAAACSDPREAELAQELVALKESRVARSSFERMQKEVAAGESAVAAFEAELETLGPQLGESQAAASALEAALQREIDRNRALNQEIREGQARLQQASERHAALEQEVAIARARTQTFKDQAAALARELRPQDPEWARRLRIQSLREFLGEVRSAWPRDPVLVEAAERELPADEAEATRLGSELAARIRDRVAEVYGLVEPSASAAPPAVASPPPGES